jgi:branched-chain amino acid aminotransferase
MEISMNLLPESERKHETIKNAESLSFGQLRSDHMFLMNYRDGQWVDPRIVPYAPIEIMPGAMSLHYGQTIFEGAKAFRHENGEIFTFRIEENAKRMNVSGEIMCIPEVPVDMQVEAIMKLIDVEREWCPTVPESSLYIRPFIFATEDALGVRPANEYIYCVLLSPSGPYYAGGFNKAVRLLITEKFHRAVPGGTGAAKACGNYAASFRAGLQAAEYDAQQVLYLDHNNEYIEEVGAMNHFHILKDGTVVIPEFTDTILKSITSLSVMELLPEMGFKVRQEKIKLSDFIKQIKSGEIIEAGGFGTAAVITPVGEYIFENGDVVTVGDGGIGENTRKIYEAYTKIQKGLAEDKFGWLKKVEKSSVNA